MRPTTDSREMSKRGRDMLALALVGPSFTGSLDENDPAVRVQLERQGVSIVSWEAHECGEVTAADIGALIICAHAPVDDALLDKFPNLRVVSNYGVGVDHIDRAACRARGIPVGNTPNVLSDATCDMAWALLMACARRVVEGDTLARSPSWTVYDNMVLLAKDVTGATLGIVGMGRIGAEVANRAKGFRMQVCPAVSRSSTLPAAHMREHAPPAHP